MAGECKPSMFNVMIDAPEDSDDASIAFNSRNGAIALLDEDASRILSKGYSVSDDEVVRRIVSELEDAGFLVDTASDELGSLRTEHEAIARDGSTFALCLVPTYACNLRCPYCYEKGNDAPAKVMGPDVIEAVMRFVEREFEREPFRMMEVQWYGGEPMAAPKTVRDLSQRLIRFCEVREIGYRAEIVTNATLIGPDEASMLAGSGVQGALITVDGIRDTHDSRRPSANGSSSFDAVIHGIGSLIDAGIEPVVIMNTDKVNDSEFDQLAAMLRDRFGIELKRAKLNDYRRTFGCDGFCNPGFDLYDHAEFTRMEARRFADGSRKARDFAQLLAPIPIFCRSQMERYFTIDASGDAYRCDGYVGRPEHIVFNIMEDESIPPNATYPFDDPRCTTCSILPMCKGNCHWERESCSDHPCHPFMYAKDIYLRGWIEAMLQEGSEPLRIGSAPN